MNRRGFFQTIGFGAIAAAVAKPAHATPPRRLWHYSNCSTIAIPGEPPGICDCGAPGLATRPRRHADGTLYAEIATREKCAACKHCPPRPQEGEERYCERMMWCSWNQYGDSSGSPPSGCFERNTCAFCKQCPDGTPNDTSEIPVERRCGGGRILKYWYDVGYKCYDHKPR